ncbi:MAG: hypothetical protein U9R02_12070 [Thermodesulfobacteriota bacterium]|nr:hypothetical protein [Thermodesulfobacteriota bacterium]
MNLPAQDYRRTHFITPDKVPKGMDAMVHGLVGLYHRRLRFDRSIKKDAEKISAMADKLRHLSEQRLRKQLGEMAVRFRRYEKGHDKILNDVFAVIVEAADRILGLRLYPVQIMGGIALYKGYFTEMATGEGKSLTACLPAILAAWTGRPCHIVTVNDYLAERDADEMLPFYSFCGVSVGCVTSQMEPEQRRLHYGRGVVYTTSKELVADFLRDRLRIGSFYDSSRRLIRQMLLPRWEGSNGLVMRGMDTAIVDEADSVLIDEAVTPLIISRAQDNKPMAEIYRTGCGIAASLELDTDYHLDLKYKEVKLTKDALKKIEILSESLPGIWRGASRRVELIQQALTAREFYKEEKQYVIHDGKIVIVDEFTGRLMPNRTWRQGLHQAVEAKEGIDVTSPSETLARISFQRFFRFFRKLSGMTGTGQEAAGEFWHIYGLPFMSIPTNKPCIRKQISDAVFPDANRKWEAIVEEIVQCNKTGRPILIGTRNVRASEKLAEMLTVRGLDFNLLNAVRHKEEAVIVAAAGEQGRITIATNMAGRGTDIKLGRGVVELGGLHVIATERHESGRIDRQLFGRSARQGDPGSAQAFMSVDDELIQRFVPGPLRKQLASAIEKRKPGAKRLSETILSHAQRAAQRLAFRQRRNVLKMDTWLEDALSFTGPGSMF